MTTKSNYPVHGAARYPKKAKQVVWTSRTKKFIYSSKVYQSLDKRFGKEKRAPHRFTNV